MASFGPNVTSECAKRPGGFTRLTPEVLDWVKQTAGIGMAILITGGWMESSAEVFLPWNNTLCQLPPLPGWRSNHVQSGSMLCAGYGSRSCLKWSVEQGGWVTLPITLSETRDAPSSWANSDGLVVMGGWSDIARVTSDIVSSDGAVTRTSFWMRYETR